MQLRQVRTLDELAAAARDAGREVKAGRITEQTAYDQLIEIANNSRLTEKHGLDFIELDIWRNLKASGHGDLDYRPAYADRVVSGEDLRKMTFDPVSYVLPGLIPDGLTILAAKPKAKKSWLMPDIAIAVAAGRFVLGDLKPAEGDVLYLALEDSQRRLQQRMDKLLGAFAEA